MSHAPLEEGKEPKRPSYVLKEAVWNGKTGSWYYLSPDGMTYTDVAKLADKHSAKPVIIDNMEENDYVYKLSPKPVDLWLGLVKGDDGKIYTVDGNLATVLNWNDGEGTEKKERYLFMMWGGKHADSLPYTMKARACLEWKYAPAGRTIAPKQK